MDARIHKLRFDLARCLQNGRTIAAYYGSLEKMQDELYKYTPLPYCSSECDCSCISIMAKQRDEEKTHQLLMGLDDDYSALRSNLLALHPLPPLNKVYELLVQQETQIRTRRHVPGELLTEILSRLPVKSLLRFRCVSKSWLNLVDHDRDFARLHLETFKNNRDETRLFVVYNEFEEGKYEFVVHCSDTFEAIQNTPASHLKTEGCSFHWLLVSSLDGLILLKSRHIGDSSLKLWNPSLRHCRDIPPIALVGILEKTLGLGYDPLAKDYNFVKLIFQKTATVPTLLWVAIYTIRDGLWKFIPFEGKGMSCSNWHWEPSPITAVYLQGCFYLSVTDAHNDKVQDLLSFDLSNKVFSLLNVSNDPDFVTGKQLILVDGGSSVALVGPYSPDKFIWVLEKETMKWTQRCSYSLVNAKVKYEKKKGDVILALARYHEHGNGEGIWRDEVLSYNQQSQKYKIFQQERTSKSNFILNIFAYVESLNLYKL